MASKYLQLFPIPTTLPHIVRDLTREILRYQPQDIIQFCVLYFRALHNKTEFVWTENNPRAPRPADYKKQMSKKELPSEKVPIKVENPEKPAKKIEVAEKIHKPEPAEEKKIEVAQKIHKPVHAEEKKDDRPIHSRESKDLNTSHLTDTSGIISLPDNNEEAANMYVDHLLESVQKHIIASS